MGNEYLDKLETEKEVGSRLNALFKDIHLFFKDRSIFIKEEKIKEIFLSFINNNLINLIECISDTSGLCNLNTENNIGNYDKQFIEYIEIAENQKTDYYKSLKDIIFGSIISVVICTDNPRNLNEIKGKKFKNFTIFLDTNYIFYLLDLYFKEFTIPAKELYELINNNNIEIKVFSFTIDEICRVINGFYKEEYLYPVSMRFDDTLYSSLKSKGWTKNKAKEFITNIENILEDRGLKIEWLDDIDIENYVPGNENIIPIFKEAKLAQSNFSRNHDIAAIETIKKIRGHNVRKLEDSKVIFLSADRKLSNLNFAKMGHNNDGTVCEVISDVLMTNILWLKNPNIKISLNTLIGAHSRGLFVKRRIWEKFYNNLKKLKQEDKITEKDISMLFYNNYIEDALREYDNNDIDQITEELTLDKIDEALNLYEKDVDKKIVLKEKALIESMDSKLSEREKEIEEQWFNKINAIKKNIRKPTIKSAKTFSIVISTICTGLIIALLVGFFYLLEFWGKSIYTNLVPIFLGGGTITIIWKKIRKHIFNKIFDKLYSKRIKEIGI